jgi:hypothetical protein
VRTAIAGHAIGEAVERRPFAEGKRQIQAFYIMDLPGMDAALEWANRLPTYGCVEVCELLQFRPSWSWARPQPPSPIRFPSSGMDLCSPARADTTATLRGRQPAGQSAHRRR